jgi:DNA-binding IclR family transcriptional regulator
MYGLKRDVARLCATGRVMLAAMPTDAATEAVEHVRNLASERRVVFDPAELTGTWHASAGGAL